MEQSDLKVGDNVHYQPSHYSEDTWENGVVKEIPDHTTTSVRVVYNCGGEWHKFMDYTSALTNLRDLKVGWKYGPGGEPNLPKTDDETDANGYPYAERFGKKFYNPF